MEYAQSVDIAAPPERVVAVMTDVERWPEWTPSVTSAEVLTPGPFTVGSRARLRQPRLPVTVWTVTAADPDTGFVWEAVAPGVRTVGEHLLTTTPTGVTVTLRLVQHGPLGVVVGALTRSLTRRYVGWEADGLRRRCEEG